MYNWDWHVIWQYRSAFLHGVLVTIELTVIVAVCGIVLGIVLALLRKSQWYLLSLPVRLYVEFFRSIPIIVLLVWIYYVLPEFDIRVSAFAAAAIALTLNMAAFVSEAVRAGMSAIHKQQLESALVLGLSRIQAFRYIILPQATRHIAPNLANLTITQLKMTSLASIIAVNELLHRANIVISNTYRPLEIYTTVGLLYVALVMPLVLLVHRYERKHGLRVQHA